MNASRLTAIAWKESLHVLRDPRALGISIVLPLILLLLFGYALTLDVDRIPYAVWDESRTPQSRELLSRFEGSRYFSQVENLDRGQDIEPLLKQGNIKMVLHIPHDFASHVSPGALSLGKNAQVQLLQDGSDSNTATLVMQYAESIIQNHSREILRKASALPLELRPQLWFNPGMESRIFIIPGLIAVIMMLISALLTSLTVAREMETGTLEPLYATPVRGSELILGKLAPYFVIGMLDMALCVLAGHILFQVPLKGSLLLLTLFSAIYLLGALGMGALISIRAKSQLLASQAAFVATFLPAFLLSGFMFDISAMPKALQLFTHMIPARYFVSMIRALYLKGTGLEALWPEALLLTAFAAFVIFLAIQSFQKTILRESAHKRPISNRQDGPC